MSHAVHVAVVLIRRDGDDAVLLTRRPVGKPMAGFWELPGGKVAPHETPADAAVREAREELGVTVVLSRALPPRPGLPGVTLHPFEATIAAGTPTPFAADAIDWVSPTRLAGLPRLPDGGALIDLPAGDLPEA